MSEDGDSINRAAELRKRIADDGLTLAGFGRKAGLSRNVVYRLAKGGKPTPEQDKKIAGTLGRQLLG